MNDQQLGKKMVEEEDFRRFAIAYEHVTGERLEIISARGERPDFICEREDGSLCGVELTEICRISPDDSLGRMILAIAEKDFKRQEPDWQMAEDTILVVQLKDVSLSRVAPALDDWVCEAFMRCGFSEVWLADYTTIEAFREVQLFGVHPVEWRGIHPRANPDKKPYG